MYNSMVVKLVSLLAFFVGISLLPLTSSEAADSLLDDSIITLPSNFFLVRDNRVPRPILKFLSLGGRRGKKFDDFKLLNYIVGIHSVNISYTDKINSLAVTYIMAGGLLMSSPVHGKVLGSTVNITLNCKEHIWKIKGETDGRSVKRITFLTTGPDGSCAAYGPYGKEGKYSFMIESHVLAFHGRYSNYLIGIGVYGLQGLVKSEQHGGQGGKDFDENISFHFPAIVGIRGFKIWNGVIFDAFQVDYLTIDYKVVSGDKFGGGGSDNITEIIFEEGERLVSVRGEADEKLINQLTLVTRKVNGQETTYGPFGCCNSREGCRPFSFSGQIMGFHGSAGDQVDRMGVYYVD